MKLICPNIRCKNPKVYKSGSYFRKSDSRLIQRYRCPRCLKKFSASTNDLCYRQKKRRINAPLKKLLCSNVSQRRAALILGVARKTVERRVAFLGKLARIEFDKFWQKQEKVEKFQFDDLQTIEHSKCKPLSVSMAISENRKIMGIEVSKMPATGHLAAIARKKYGRRKDERQKGLLNLFKKIKEITTQNPEICSDEHPFYPPFVNKIFPESNYQRVKGARGSIAGQGELKKLRYDPLFTLNHTFAMCRANINRLIRKTWCTTKDPSRLLDHLYIYAVFHNEILTR